ncbi:MAG: hypothetical protein MJK04_18080, partial [Psychrosphaera sp.]|nr:hypothetical protein [Psychrosphaera sp.]
ECLDGIIDIARYGIEPLSHLKPTQHVVNKLAYQIVRMATGQKVEHEEFDPDTFDDFDDDDPLLFGGRALLTVLPLKIVDDYEFPDDDRF